MARISCAETTGDCAWRAPSRKAGEPARSCSGPKRGARVAVVPYDVERKAGTIALWYTPPAPRADPARKSEATYVEDRLHGEKRSWHPNGNPRAVLRYERGELVAARAWDETGAPLPEAEAREMAARDLVTDERFYATLEALVSDHRPKCE